LLSKIKSNNPIPEQNKVQPKIYDHSIVGTLEETKDTLLEVIELQKSNVYKLESLL